MMLPLLAALVLAAPVAAADANHEAQALEAARDSMVRVAWTLRYDRGEAPDGGGFGERCPRCGRVHGVDLESYVDEQRPVEIAGFVLSPTRVVTRDPLVHQRFVEQVEVIFGDERYPARLAGVGLDRAAVFLETEAPIAGAQALELPGEFSYPVALGGSGETTSKPSVIAVTAGDEDGAWTTMAQPLSLQPSQRAGEEPTYIAPSGALVIGGEQAVSIAMGGELPVGGAWPAPRDWPALDATELQSALADLEQRAAGQIARVELRFRSPRNESGQAAWMEQEQATQQSVAGVVLGDRVLVLAALEPQTTARLERIIVHAPGGAASDASFEATLSDYGAFVAQLEGAGSGTPARALPIERYRNGMLLGAEVRILGENRVSHMHRCRLHAIERGWKGRLYPMLAGATDDFFAYDLEGRLVAIPVARRHKIDSGHSWDADQPRATAMADLWAVLDDLENHVDADNVPLSEDEENRIAWLGVELQALDEQLARMHGVADQTSDGSTGALVIHVYPGSPAERAGIEVGDILLRLHVSNLPRPLEVEAEGDMFGFGGGYPWEHWDDLPEEYFDQMPTPWPGADSDLNTRLTTLGFGTAYRAEIHRDGAAIEVPLEVVQGPAHYGSAPRATSEELGLTVRDLTYEVRRYFQLDDDEPGVIISHLEPGEPASVAGLRPYELITSVDDEAVHSAAEFESALAESGEHRLAVRRMTVGRIVKVHTTAGLEVPEEEAAVPLEGG